MEDSNDYTTRDIESIAELILRKFRELNRGIYIHDVSSLIPEYDYKSKMHAFNILINNEFVEELPFKTATYIISNKGRKFKSFKKERLKKWYRDLPKNNWLIADILKFSITTIIGLTAGFIGGILSTSVYTKWQMKKQPEKVEMVKDIKSYPKDSAHYHK